MTHAVLHRPSLLFGAALFVASSSAAFAQYDAPDEEVTIDAPYTVHHATRMEGPPFRETTNIAISRTVNYGDLDFSQWWGRELLRIRINEAARDVCREIDRRYPIGVYVSMSDDSQCARDAAVNARTQVREMMATGEMRRGVSVAALP